jgi:hypothetical protein
MTTALYCPSSDTSQAAAASIEPHLDRLERNVLNIIRAFEPNGLTCDELEWKTGLLHTTASARIHSLHHKKGLIHDSGIRRKTRSGRSAVVYRCNA